jgi:hypothetical protein
MRESITLRQLLRGTVIGVMGLGVTRTLGACSFNTVDEKRPGGIRQQRAGHRYRLYGSCPPAGPFEPGVASTAWTGHVGAGA